jgi:hypothetical protein
LLRIEVLIALTCELFGRAFSLATWRGVVTPLKPSGKEIV